MKEVQVELIYPADPADADIDAGLMALVSIALDCSPPTLPNKISLAGQSGEQER